MQTQRQGPNFAVIMESWLLSDLSFLATNIAVEDRNFLVANMRHFAGQVEFT